MITAIVLYVLVQLAVIAVWAELHAELRRERRDGDWADRFIESFTLADIAAGSLNFEAADCPTSWVTS